MNKTIGKLRYNKECKMLQNVDIDNDELAFRPGTSDFSVDYL